MSYIVASILESRVLTVVGPFSTQTEAERWKACKGVPPASEVIQFLVMPLVAPAAAPAEPQGGEG